VGELRKLLDDDDATIAVSVSETKVRFATPAITLTSQVIDGTFPDYSRVIPTANDKLLRIDPRSFEEGVDRVATIATEKTRAVKMALDRDKITLSVTSPENGSAAEEVPGDYVRQLRDRLQRALSARYSRPDRGRCGELHLADQAAPTDPQNDRSPALYVLMPMRV
jgi:DNA polymerase-3 subunit beta